jgi:hypothetical protein
MEELKSLEVSSGGLLSQDCSLLQGGVALREGVTLSAYGE